MRSKEFAHDYRYFPEPDLPPLKVSRRQIDEIRAALPELPSARRARYLEDFGLSHYEIDVLTQDREVSDYFEEVIKAPGVSNRKAAANWVMTEVLRAVRESARPIAEAAPKASEVGELLAMIEKGAISHNAGKTAFVAMCKSGKSASATVAELGLAQVSDQDAIAAACDSVIAANADKVAEYRAGRDKLFGFFVGAVMKAMGGKANPKIINETLKSKLAG